MRGEQAERWDVLAAVGIGGAMGSLLRYVVGDLLPHAPGAFPWSTFLINLFGCLVIGSFMVLLTEAALTHRLLQPFLGIGVLGGFTTFSTYAVDTIQTTTAGHPLVALLYLAGTVTSTLAGVAAGMASTRTLIRKSRRVAEVER